MKINPPFETNALDQKVVFFYLERTFGQKFQLPKNGGYCTLSGCLWEWEVSPYISRTAETLGEDSSIF